MSEIQFSLLAVYLEDAKYSLEKWQNWNSLTVPHEISPEFFGNQIAY